MKYFILLFFLSLYACSLSIEYEEGVGADTDTEATINYSLKASVADSIQAIELTLENVAIKTNWETVVSRDIDLLEGTYILSTQLPLNTINLGSSTLRSGRVERFELEFNATAFLTINGFRTQVEMQQPENLSLPFFLGEPVEVGDIIEVIFELDMDQSELKNENGSLKFYPEFNLLWNP